MAAALVDGCLICNGMGQVAAGQACPVCGGTGVATAEQSAAYRQMLVDAAVEAATERFRVAGTNAAEGILRGLAQARADAEETKARAGQVLEALKNARQAAWVSQQAAMRVRGAELIVSRAEDAASRVATVLAGPPDPTDPPPGLTLPPGFGGEIFYMDSLLVRQLDALNLNVAGSGGLLVNPMTTLGDLIVGGALGAAGRLAVGANGLVLTVVGGIPAWAATSASLTNPMTTVNDLIVATAGGVPGRLAVGTLAQVLTVTAGGVAWANAPSGFANPMTTMGDIIVGTAGGGAARLPIGAPGQVLTAGSTPTWQTNPAGFPNPMTTSGDLITASAGGTAVRLPIGANGTVLAVAGGVPQWSASPSTLGTPLAGPSGTPTVWRQADGSILVLPLSFYSLTGDDAVWINSAFTFLPTRTEQYGTQTHTWTYGRVWLQAQQYSIQTTINLPPMVDLIGQGSGTELLASTAGMTCIYWHSASTDGGATGPSVNARHVCATIDKIRVDGTIASAATPASTTVAVGSNGVNPATWTNNSPGTLSVASSATFSSTGGMLTIPTTNTPVVVSYTGTSSGTITGCVYVAGGMNTAGAAGTLATGGAVTASLVGIDMGDGHGFRNFAQVVNFTAAGAIGLLFANRLAYTEKCWVRTDLLNNTNAAVFTNLAGVNNVSQEYNEITLVVQAQYPGQTGATISAGAYLAGGSFRMYGNFPVFAGTACGPALTINISDGSGNNSNIHDTDVYINVEANGSGVSPQTILLGANVNNGITNSEGIMSFRNVAFTASNLTTQNFSFGGPIHGDTTLSAAAATAAGRTAATAPVGWV